MAVSYQNGRTGLVLMIWESQPAFGAFLLWSQRDPKPLAKLGDYQVNPYAGM